MKEPVVLGTCDGTGAAINVCLGFTPSFVQVWNLDDATDIPSLVWHRSMKAVSACDEGIKDVTAAGLTRALIAANGISAYDGGDTIVYDSSDSRWESLAAADVSEVYVDGHYNRSASTDAAYRSYGAAVVDAPYDGQKIKTVPGFTIGTDTHINVDGQQLVFAAWR